MADPICSIIVTPTDASSTELSVGSDATMTLTKVAHRYLAAADDEYTDPDDEMATLQHALSDG